MATALVILAAGEGSRMQSSRPKVLHEIGQAPMLAHALRSGAAVTPSRIVVVTGYGAEEVEAAVSDYAPEAQTVHQAERLGTGHAVLQARPLLEDFDGDILVLYGDTPFIEAGTLAAIAEARARADIVVLGFEAVDPGRYGRLITDGDRLIKIVEYKDATVDERAVTMCNSGILAADAKTLFDLLANVGNANAAGEYYLTDVPGLATEAGLTATVVACPERETQGINTRAELANAEATFQAECRRTALETGAHLIDPSSVHFAFDTHLGRDCIVEPYVVFGPGVTVETGAHIRAFSHLEGCHVSAGATVGPYARLRPGAEIGNDARIGNFVEVKAAEIGEGAKVNHLSYVGDATIGAAANLGAGTITCNYDGVFKHRSVVGDGAFIGSNTMLVAPVTVGDRAMTASGSVITQDVPAEDLGLGRARQVNKPKLGARIMDRLRSLKASKKG